MSNELIIPSENALSKYSTPENFEATTSAGYLSRVQVMGSSCNEVKKKLFPMGEFALVNGKSFKQLSTEFDAYVLSWRPKAMQFIPEVLSFYNPRSDDFKKIQARAGQPNAGCGFGSEFLLWIPTFECFATFFMGNSSGRRESPAVMTFLGKAATFKCVYIETKQNSWHAAEVRKCEIDLGQPDVDKMNEVLAEFNNPPETETVGEEATARAR